MKLKIFIIFSLLFLVSSCGNKERVDREVLAKTYVDLLIAEQQFMEKPDSLLIKKSEIFAENNLSEEEYLSALEKYSSEKEKWDQFFKYAQTYLDSLQEENLPK